MNEATPNPRPVDIQAELARERNHIAAERSLLSFIRISVTFIGIGAGIDQILKILTPTAPYQGIWAYSLTLTFVGLGVINVLCAALDYQGEIHRLKQPEYYFTPRWSIGNLTGLTLFIAGLAFFVRLLLQQLLR